MVPGGRFSGLARCCMPSGGVGNGPAASWTVPSAAGPGVGPGVGIAGSATAGAGGAGMTGTGSANAVGALNVYAAMIPSAPDAIVSAVVPLLILTRAPFRCRCYRVLPFDRQNCYTWDSCDEAVNKISGFREHVSLGV